VSTVQARVHRRYVEAARILPLVVDKTRFIRWITGITKNVVTDVEILGAHGSTVKVIASFEGGKKILYDVVFDFTRSGDGNAVEILPTVKAIRFEK
jgi:hypothetical protein